MKKRRKPAPTDPFTPTERDVLFSVLLGETVREGAIRVGMSQRCVKFHRTNVFMKLQVKNQQQAQAKLIMKMMNILEVE